jgi:hypothetical protein
MSAVKPLEFLVPVETPNPLNGAHGHHFAAAGIRKKVKAAVFEAVPEIPLKPLFVVVITRFSAGTLDDDNLVAALKPVRDAIAHRLGLDDGSLLVKFLCNQGAAPRGKQSVRVVIWPAEQRPALDSEVLMPAPYEPPEPKVGPARPQIRTTRPKDIRLLAKPASYPARKP